MGPKQEAMGSNFDFVFISVMLTIYWLVVKLNNPSASSSMPYLSAPEDFYGVIL